MTLCRSHIRAVYNDCEFIHSAFANGTKLRRLSPVYPIAFVLHFAECYLRGEHSNFLNEYSRIAKLYNYVHTICGQG